MQKSDAKNDDNLLYKNLFSLVLKKINLMLVIILTGASLSLVYSLSLENIYKSKMLLIPSSGEDSLLDNDTLSLLSSTRYNIGNQQVSKSEEGLARIKSYDFFINYFLPNIRLENLIAQKKWVSQSNSIIYDKKIYDSEKNKWTKKTSNKNETPSLQEAYKIYKQILSIQENQLNAFVTISIEHISPYIAKRWLEIILYEVNESMRIADQIQAEKAIIFLNEKSKSVNLQPLRDSLAALLEEEMRTIMLTSSNQLYVFNAIDPPIVPEFKSKPSRALICILGTMLSIILALLAIIAMNFKLILNR